MPTVARKLVLDLLRRTPPGRLLDIPSGGGPVVDAARDAGWNVCELDLFARPTLRGVRADACAPLPFRDGAFDAIVSMEGIEHFEDQTSFLRECGRVLKPSGHLILTTPNVLHLSGRVATFLTGQRQLKHGFVNEFATLRQRDGERLYHGHAFLIDVFRLRYLLRIAGLRLQGLRTCAVSPSALLCAPFVPAIWLATRFSLAAGRNRLVRARRTAPPPEVERELSALAFSPALLFGRKLVVSAVRE